MPDKSGRHQVGDTDPEGQKALRDSIAGKKTPPVKAAPEDSEKPPKKHRELRRGPKGKTIMETVDEAVAGAKGASGEY